MTAPDRIYINKVHGQHPEDWNFTDGQHLTKRQLAEKVEYVRADLALLSALDEAEARATRAYSERTAAAVAMARLATMAGFNAGIGQDNNEAWDAEWRVVLYVDTPAGQVSWHIAPHDQHLLADLPQYDGEWDGTYRSRDGSFSNWSAMQTNAEAERDAANLLLREIEQHLAKISGFFFDTFPRKEIRAHLGAKP